MVWKACWIIVDVVVNCAMLWKWSSPRNFCDMSFHCCEPRLWQVLCTLRKNKKLKRMYHFEVRITRRDGYYILRDISHDAMVLLSRVVAHAAMDAWTDMSLIGPTLRHNECIIRSDMHHYTWHWISSHCTTFLLVNLTLCVADLVSAFLWNLWLINNEFVVEDMQLLECCWDMFL